MPAFTWTNEATFEAVNVLSATEERFWQAQWHCWMWCYPEQYLRELIDDVPLAEPIDLDAVDWHQVADALLSTTPVHTDRRTA